VAGNRAESILESVGIIANRNVIPRDPQPPGITSGIRIGSTAMTARGMGRREVLQIVDLIDTALQQPHMQGLLEEISEAVSGLCRKFPIYKQP
jgi:glycine hydroxymethyltransferase